MSKLPGGWRGIHRRNWSAGPQASHDPDIVPSTWDKMLRELRICDEQALAEIKRRSALGAKLRKAAYEGNRLGLFTPESICVALGIPTS